LLENGIKLRLSEWISKHLALIQARNLMHAHLQKTAAIEALGGVAPEANGAWLSDQTQDLISFFIDRLKVYLREKGTRHDVIDAAISAASAFSPQGEDQISA